jgi:hypothetical protein
LSLEDLTLECVCFVSDDDSQLSAEQERAAWIALLSSVPHLHRLGIDDGDLTHLLPIMPLHLPLLEHLSLSGCCDDDVDPCSEMAHPNVRLLEIGSINTHIPSDEQLRMCMQSERLPKLERCVRGSR